MMGREVPVILADAGGSAWSGYCDLVYRDGDGVIVVADYKTDRVADDAAVAELVARYRPQLAVYRDALARALPGAKIRAEILFVRTGTIAVI